MYPHVFPPHWIKGFGIISSTLLYFVGLTETGTGFGGKGIWGKRFSKIWNRPPEDHSWQGGPNPHLPSPNFMKDPYIDFAYTPFYKFCPTLSPFPCHLQLPPPLFLMLSCFFGWMGDCTTFDVLFYLMLLWIYTFLALGP